MAIQRQTVAVNKAEIARAEALLQQAAGREALVRQRAQEVAAAEARAADAAGVVRIAATNLERTVIRAAADGWVTNLTTEVGQVLQQLEADGSLAGHHQRVVERMDQGEAAFLLKRQAGV